MHVHTDDAPVRLFAVILFGDEGTHEIHVEAPCPCGMLDFVNRLPDLPFRPQFIRTTLAPESSRLSYSR